MGPIQSLEDLVGLILRRRWLIALITVIGTALGAWYAESRPDTFETAAVIQVELPMVAEGRTPSAPVNALQTLQTIEQRLTTRDNMIALIDRHRLFAQAPGMSVENKVAAMRRAIRFQSVSNAAGGGLSAIIIAAQADTAENAARVANDLAQSVLDMGAEGKRATADASFAFFKDEEGRIWKAINALETEIATYREANRAALPGAREARQDELTQLATSLQALNQELAGLQSEETSIRAQQTLRATDRRRLEDIGQRLSVLDAQRAPLLARKTEVDGSLGDVAEVDRVLSTYDRQLRQLQDQYSVVSTRLAEADTTQRLSDRQQTERFSLLERAITPEYPVRSGGKRIAIAGAIGSAALALTLAFLLDLAKPVLRNSGQMERELNLRPIVAIPPVPARARTARGRKAIKTLIESEMGRLPTGGVLGNAVILAGAALMLMLAVAVGG